MLRNLGIIETDTIWLESILKATPDALQNIADNKSVAQNLRDAFPHPYTLDNAVTFLDNVRQRKMGIVYGMFLNSGELVGVISLTPDRDVNRYSAEVGYFVGEQYWNRGYATEALRLVGNFAQFRHGLKRLYAMVFDYNLASMCVLEKAGFKKEGIMKSSAVKDDKILDEHLYGLVLGKSNIEIIGPIDNYRLTSAEEPTDKMLAQIMHEAVEEAAQKRYEAMARFFGQLKQDAEKIAATSHCNE